MYERIVILEARPDLEEGGLSAVTLGFFDSKGIEQLRVPEVSGKLFPPDAKKKDSVIFTRYGRLDLLRRID